MGQADTVPVCRLAPKERILASPQWVGVAKRLDTVSLQGNTFLRERF